MTAKLNKLINELSDAPFVYGKCDCYIFTARLVEEWHGKSYFMHKVYKNKKQAIAYMEKFGGLEALTVGTLGYPVRAADCVDGDVAIAKVGPEGSPVLGFVFNGYALFKGKKKVLKLPLSKCDRGWRIR